MSILENLVQGFAGAAGDQGTVDRVDKLKSDRKATAEEELHANTKSILNDVAGLQDQRAKLDPVKDKDKIAGIDQQLHTMRQTFTDMYHPDKNPGALAHLGGILKAHLGGQKPAPSAPQLTPGQAREKMASTMAGFDSAAAGTKNPDDNPYVKQRKELVDAGFSGEDADRVIRQKIGLDAKESPTKFQPQLTETTDKDGTKHYFRVPLEAGGQPEEVDFHGQKVSPKGSAATKQVRAWKKINGKTTSVLIDPATNKEIPGSENPDILPPATMSGRISTGFYHWKDDDGNVHATPETHTSGPASGGAGATPGDLRSKAQSNVPSDRILGHSDTPVQSKARNEYVQAVKLSSVADQVAKNPNDAVNQKRLAVALERQAAGRFTTQALDYIVKSGWGNTLEQWANNPSTGALPQDVIRQLVDGAHQNLEASKQALDEAVKGNKSAPPAASKPSGKAVSLAKAKLLPQNKGKSDDVIRKDIEAHGHTVTD